MLPQIDADFRAISRYAAGRFFTNDHRGLAILHPVDAIAGDVDNIAQFRKRAKDSVVHDVHCEARPGEVIQALDRFLQRAQPQTDLYVLHPEHCVTAISYLSKRGHTDPERLSVICRDD